MISRSILKGTTTLGELRQKMGKRQQGGPAPRPHPQFLPGVGAAEPTPDKLSHPCNGPARDGQQLARHTRSTHARATRAHGSDAKPCSSLFTHGTAFLRGRLVREGGQAAGGAEEMCGPFPLVRRLPLLQRLLAVCARDLDWLGGLLLG